MRLVVLRGTLDASGITNLLYVEDDGSVKYADVHDPRDGRTIRLTPTGGTGASVDALKEHLEQWFKMPFERYDP